MDEAVKDTQELPVVSDDVKTTNDPAEMARQIAALNQENASRRLREKELAEKLAKFDEAKKEAEEKAALERGEHKSLYESAKTELEGATGKIAAYEATLTKLLEAETANVPEQFRALIPEGEITTKLAWIATAKANKLFVPVTGPGVKEPGTHEKGTLEAELAAAKESGNVQAVISIKKRIFDRDHH